MADKIIMGVSGLPGSFSEEAALRYGERANLSFQLAYLVDMEGVLSALVQKKIDMGIFPVVNIHGGLVKPAFEAMGKYLFVPIDELWLDVNQCLLALPGTKLHQIKKIVSHPQAFAQCKNYLKNEMGHAELIPWIDTAKAAKDLSEGMVSGTMTAVIAPERSAEIYHLEVLTKNIQDNTPNLTAFIITKRHQ
jgi:prephenate dehydratase